MTMSRMALMAAAAFQTPAEPPKLVSAEQALEMHEETFEGTVSADPCPQGADGEEIVVCGRRGESPYRYTGPVTREPGAPQELPGEVGRAPTSVGGCLSRCYQPVMIDVIGAGIAVVKGVKKLLDPDR